MKFFLHVCSLISVPKTIHPIFRNGGSIIFGTNLLTQIPVPVPVFSLISVFRRKGISNGVHTEWNHRESYFWNGSNPGDLECMSGNQQGGYEAGGQLVCFGDQLAGSVTLESMHRGWHTFSSWLSGRNFGALFEVLCVGLNRWIWDCVMHIV